MKAIFKTKKRFTAATAMTEFVLIVPVLAVILAMIFFLGRANQDKYYAANSVRYYADRSARNTDAASEDYENADGFSMPQQYSPDLAYYSVGSDLMDLWVDKISENSDSAAIFAGILLDGHSVNDRGDNYIYLDINLRDRLNLGRNFAGTVSVSAAANGGEFEHFSNGVEAAVADYYLNELETELFGSTYFPPELVNMIREIYRRRW